MGVSRGGGLFFVEEVSVVVRVVVLVIRGLFVRVCVQIQMLVAE